MHQFGTNVVRFQMATGERRWYIIGCYLAPTDNLSIESVVAAIKYHPRGSKVLVVEDLNINLEEPEGDWREEYIVEVLTMTRLEEVSDHFLPRRRLWCRDGRTWSMVRMWREVRSSTDFIPEIDRRLFMNVSVQEPRHKSDH